MTAIFNVLVCDEMFILLKKKYTGNSKYINYFDVKFKYIEIIKNDPSENSQITIFKKLILKM